MTASHAQDGLNLRVRTTVGMTTTTYAWDLGAGLPVMLSDGPFSEYIYGHDLIGHIATSGGMTTAKYAHADVLGSVRLLTDGTGTEAGTALYDAFGVVRVQTGVQLPLGYTGEQRDAESGLIYLRARYYDPKTGRFLSKDPVRGSATRPASQHAYAYASNNPARYTDRTGRAVDDSGDIGFDYEALPAGSGPDAPLPTPDDDVPSIESVKAEDDPLCEFDCVPIKLSNAILQRPFSPGWQCRLKCRALCFAALQYVCASIGATAGAFCILGGPMGVAVCFTIGSGACQAGAALTPINDCSTKCIANNCN